MKKIKLTGSKSEALFDWWSINHALFFFVLSKFYLYRFHLERAILIAIALAFFWEFIERALEDLDHKKIFFKEKEGWLNRYVGDLISGIAGFLLGYFL